MERFKYIVTLVEPETLNTYNVQVEATAVNFVGQGTAHLVNGDNGKSTIFRAGLWRKIEGGENREIASAGKVLIDGEISLFNSTVSYLPNTNVAILKLFRIIQNQDAQTMNTSPQSYEVLHALYLAPEAYDYIQVIPPQAN